MRTVISLFVLARTFLSLAAFGHSAESVPVTVTVEPHTTQCVISPQAAGLSYESAVLHPTNGYRYFSPRNTTLVRLFKTLGLKSLRLGGVTVDRPQTVIDQTDVDELFTFAQAAEAKVIYSFKLKDGDIPATKIMAKYIFDHYAANLDCVAIGNEPNEFLPNYAAFMPLWEPFMDALSQEVPGLKFCGPTAWGEDWARRFSIDISAERAAKLAFVAQHEYAFGPQKLIKDPAAAREKMLDIKDYDNWYKRFVPAVLERGLRYRIEEASNYSNGGAADVSDTYAAALWSLDYLYWWCSHQAIGVNFHTGDFQRYSAFKTSPDGYDISPLAYGLLAFNLGGHGQFISSHTDLPENSPPVNFRCYATRSDSGELFLTLINRSHGATAHAADVTVVLPESYPDTNAQVCTLAAPGGDIATKTGITIGGEPITSDGNWKGQWLPISSLTQHRLQVVVPAATASVIKLTNAQPTAPQSH